MICPNCAASLEGAPPLCPRCGHPILEDDRTVALSFDGEPVEALGWMLLSIVSAIVIVPLAWTLAAFGRWFCRHLHFSDGTAVAFTGEALEVLGWMALTALLSLPNGLLSVMHSPVPVLVVFEIGMVFVAVQVQLSILRWIVRHLELSKGPELHFSGSYSGYLGYHVLIAVSVLTIIGWAWALASYYGWVADHIRGKGVAFRCEVEGWDVLWRMVAAILGSIPILTIPWVWTWYTRWLASNISMTRGAGVGDA